MKKLIIVILFIACTINLNSRNIIPYTTVPHLDTAISYYNTGGRQQTKNKLWKVAEL